MNCGLCVTMTCRGDTGSSVDTDALLWWGMLIMKEQGAYANSQFCCEPKTAFFFFSFLLFSFFYINLFILIGG